MTALAKAFEANGVTPREAAFNVAIAKFQNNGGAYGVAVAMLDAAYGKGSGGPKKGASDGPEGFADASRPNDGEAGHQPGAERANNEPPASPSSPPVNVTEHRRHLPGHAKRGATAIASVQGTLARVAFAAVKLPDGRSIGEVRWSEAPDLAQKYARNARIILAAHRFAIPPDPTMTLGECVPLDEQQRIVTTMEAINAL